MRCKSRDAKLAWSAFLTSVPSCPATSLGLPLTSEGHFAASSPNSMQGNSGTGTSEGVPRSPCTVSIRAVATPSSQCSPFHQTSSQWAGHAAGRSNLLQPGIRKRRGLQDSFQSSPRPARPGVFLQGAHGGAPPPSPRHGCLLQLRQMFLGPLASHRGVGAESPCSREFWANAQPWHGPLSLADLSGSGHHDRCWEHMPRINSLRHSHKRDGASSVCSRLPRFLISTSPKEKPDFPLPCS